MKACTLVVLLLCAVGALAVRVDVTRKPTTSMGKAFQSIDNNLIGLINCAARRSQRSPSLLEVDQTPCANAAAAVTAQVPAVSAQTVIPVTESTPVIESSKCSQKAAQAVASSSSSSSSAAPDITARELAEYFESVNGNKPIKGDSIMQLCKHAGGPFAGVFRKIRKAATGLAAAIQGLLPLFKAHDHDQAEEAEQPAPAAAAPAAPAAAAPAAAPAFVQVSQPVVTAQVAGQAPATPTQTTVPVAVVSATTVTTSSSSSRRKIRFDREHKPISEAVCDFLVRHVNDLSSVCPNAADDQDGDKIVTGLIGHALAVALRG